MRIQTINCAMCYVLSSGNVEKATLYRTYICWRAAIPGYRPIQTQPRVTQRRVEPAHQ